MKITAQHLDDSNSSLRLLEMIVESMTCDVGHTVQFFRDLNLYGLREAMSYLAQHFPRNEEYEKDWAELDAILTAKEKEHNKS